MGWGKERNRLHVVGVVCCVVEVVRCGYIGRLVETLVGNVGNSFDEGAEIKVGLPPNPLAVQMVWLPNEVSWVDVEKRRRELGGRTLLRGPGRIRLLGQF